MGHGVRSSLVVSMMRGVIEKAKKAQNDASAFITLLNEGLSGIFGRAGLTLFATACYSVIDFKTNEVHIVSAGHDFPIVLRKDKQPHHFPRRSKGRALGLFSTAKYRASTISLQNIDSLILYTDGIFECANSQEEDWGRERLWASILQHQHKPLQELLTAVFNDASSWISPSKFDDDVCMLAISLSDQDDDQEKPNV